MNVLPMKRGTFASMESLTIEVMTPCNSGFFMFDHQDGKIVRVRCRIGKNGGCARASLDTMAHIMTIALTAGAEIEEISKTLVGVCCARAPRWDTHEQRLIFSCHEAMGIAINEALRILDQDRAGLAESA